jgi:ABC-2 type transport system permease protein
MSPPTSLRLVKSELLKIRTTNAWWIFAIVSAVTDCLVMAVTLSRTHFLLNQPIPQALHASPEKLAAFQAARELRLNGVRVAADIFTAGEVMGGLLSMLLAITLVTNEYQHQTATTTFLTTPKRTPVILAKLAAAIVAAGVFWSIGAVINVIAGVIFLRAEGLPTHLGDWEVIRSMLLNLMVYGLWAVFGIGIGALIRNQFAATISASLGYLVGNQVAQTVFLLIHKFWIKEDWVLTAMVVVPSQAASIAVSPLKTYPQSVSQWVGAAVLIGYGLVFGGIGTWIIRKRDVS